MTTTGRETLEALQANPRFRARLARRAAAIRAGRLRAQNVPPYSEWLSRKWRPPQWNWEWAHLLLVQDVLKKVTSGEIRRLAIFMPPRHGKSELVTIRYPAWRIDRDPSTRVILGAHTATLSAKFSRRSRSIIRATEGIRLTKDSDIEWETEAGGGLYAAGVGGSVAGRGAHLIIIDDPVKSRQEAHSEAYRNRVSGWYHTDLWTRQEPGCAIILIMTRWHPQDLGGEVLTGAERDEWHIVRLPGLAETQAERDKYFESIKRYDLLGQPDPLGRAPGEPLLPERYDVEYYESAQGVMGADFGAIVQQRPVPPEGGMFKRSWFEIIDGIPGADKKPYVDAQGRVHKPPVYPAVRYWDKAGSKDARACLTAGIRLVAGPFNAVYVTDAVLGKWEAAERESMIDRTARRDGKGTVVIVEQEPGSGGLESAQNTVRRLARMGYTCYADRPTGDKVLRAEPLASLASARGVKLIKAEWNGTLLDILAGFPHGIKDPVDAMSGGLKWLRHAGKIEITDNPFYQ